MFEDNEVENVEVLFDGGAVAGVVWLQCVYSWLANVADKDSGEKFFPGLAAETEEWQTSATLYQEDPDETQGWANLLDDYLERLGYSLGCFVWVEDGDIWAGDLR